MPTVVVLPAPFGPSSPKISPRCTARSRRSTARTWPPRPSKTLVSATVRMTPPSPSVRGLGIRRVARRSSCVPILRPGVHRAVGLDAEVARGATGRCCCHGGRLEYPPPRVGGHHVTFYGVRGSTPCTGPEYARYGGHSSCVVLEADDQPPILFDLGTGLRPYGMTLRGRVPRHRAAVAPALGSRAGPAVLRAAAPRGRDARRLRAAPGRRAARRRVRADDAPAVLPDPPDRPRPATCASTTPATTTSRSGSPRCARAGCATSGRRSASASSGTASRSRTSPTTGRACVADRRRRLRPARGARAVRRRRRAHPRRAAHARRVRAQAALGPLHRRLRGARRARSRRAQPRAVPPRPAARRRRHGPHRDATPASSPRAWACPRSSSPATACSSSSRRTRRARPPRARDEPVGTAPARSRRRDLPDRARPLRDRRRDRHRDRRRRAGRHGVQLVHVGVARPAARAVLRGEVVDHVAAHPGRGQVGREHPRRRRRGGLPAVRAEGRRPLRPHRVHARAAPARRSSRTRSRSSTARRSPSTTPATT